MNLAFFDLPEKDDMWEMVHKYWAKVKNIEISNGGDPVNFKLRKWLDGYKY